MVAQKKKSLVVQKNSWKPFLEEIQGALLSKDFRKETICKILKTLDIDISTWPGSFFRYIGGAIIGSGFPIGRSLLYGDIFRRFLENNQKFFQGAPLIVIQEFNRLVKTIFLEKTAKKLFLEESIARRKLSPEEKLQIKAKKAQEHFEDLVRKASKESSLSYAKETQEPVSEEISEFVFERKKQFVINTHLLSSKSIALFQKLSDEGLNIDPELIQDIEKSGEAFNTYIQNFFSTFPKSSLGHFQDLIQTVRSLDSRLSFDEPEARELLFCNEKERPHFLEEKIKKTKIPFEAHFEKARKIQNDIATIEKELSRAKLLLEPFLKKKETKDRVAVLLSEINRLRLTESVLSEKTPLLEQTVEEKKKKTESLITDFQKEFSELLARLQRSESENDTLTLCILHARWEFFSQKTPFFDLHDLLEQSEKDILSTHSHCNEELIAGEKGYDEIRREMLESLYTHNVKLVRMELLSRALRLKDIRGEVEKELLDLDRLISLLKLSGKSPEPLLKERAWLFSFYEKLLSPFQVFKDTCDPESINILFRYFWIDLDRFKKGNEQRKFALETVVNDPQVIHALKNTFEIMEKLFFDNKKIEKGILPWLETVDQEFALLPLIAAYPYGKREQFLLELKKLHERKKGIEKLALAIQAAKTFEPERIDALSEAFTLLRFSKNPFKQLEKRLVTLNQILDRIEEAVFCEIGFTDSSSRMESGYALNELVKEAKKRLNSIQKLAENLLKEQTEKPNFIGKVSKILLENSPSPKEDLFEYAQEISQLFFQYRLLSTASSENSFSRLVLILILVSKTFSELSKKLPPEKTQKISELFLFSRKLFNLIFPAPQKEEICEFLKEFSQKAKLVAGNTEISILSEIDVVEKGLKSIISWEKPIISFVPGDLNFFLE